MRGGGTRGWGRGSRLSTRKRRSDVERADYAKKATVDDVGVDRRGPHILVTEQCLNRPDAGARLEQVGREVVAEGMSCRALGEPRRASGIVNGPLHRHLVQAVEDLSTSRWIGARARGGGNLQQQRT